MVEGIISTNNSYPVSFSSQRHYDFDPKTHFNKPLHSFDNEDSAIISAQARLLNELEKYNSGAGNEIDLALTCVTSQRQVEAQVAVIKTKTRIMDSLMEIGES